MTIKQKVILTKKEQSILRKALLKSLKAVSDMKEELDKSRKLTYEQLNTPFDI